METYRGHVRTPQDAIILFEACRLGLLPRVQRRLSEKERSQIKSGSVFVWDEREAGMRRWTDGKSWSASRVSGSFLTYREMEGKRGSTSLQLQSQPTRSKSANGGSKNSNGFQDGESDEGTEGPDGYRYKPDGLMKQSFSITTQDQRHLHLISYYNRSNLPPVTPSNDPSLRNIQPQKGMYPENAVNEASSVASVGRPPMSASPYPAHPPPGMVVAAYPWPPPLAYPAPPGGIAYPVAWPPSPGATPPHYYAHPAYVTAPYGQPLFSAPGQHPLDRQAPAPAQPPTLPKGLPLPSAKAGQNGWPPARSPDGHPYQRLSPPGYHQSPYSASRPPSQGSTLAPVTGNYKPPSPPTSNGSAAIKAYSEPPPLKALPAASGNSPPNKIIPSITALINGPTGPNGPRIPRGESKSPNRVAIKGMPNAMTAMGIQRDRGDLKKLDSQLLKGRS